jgi:hypothetical protein
VTRGAEQTSITAAISVISSPSPSLPIARVSSLPPSPGDASFRSASARSLASNGKRKRRSVARSPDVARERYARAIESSINIPRAGRAIAIPLRLLLAPVMTLMAAGCRAGYVLANNVGARAAPVKNVFGSRK